MRVNRTTGEMYLLELVIKGVNATVDGLNLPLSGVTLKVYQPLTIDSVFDSIAQTIADVEAGTGGEVRGNSTVYHDYEVRFDPTVGYPTLFRTDARTTLTPQEITWRTNEKNLELSGFNDVK